MWACCFLNKYSFIVEITQDLVVFVFAAYSLVRIRLSASINTADKITLLLSMTDFEFMTPSLSGLTCDPHGGQKNSQLLQYKSRTSRVFAFEELRRCYSWIVRVITVLMTNTWTQSVVQGSSKKRAGRTDRHDIMVEQANKEGLPAIVFPVCSGLGNVSPHHFLWHTDHT